MHDITRVNIIQKRHTIMKNIVSHLPRNMRLYNL